MQLEAGCLCYGDQTFNTVDCDVRLVVARDFDEIEQAGHAWHGVALEEPLATNAIRSANDGARAALEVWQHPIADGRKVFGEVLFGHRFAVTAIWP
jgi:hypothetical protein